MTGKLIVFEGIEGCGKSTQIQHLYNWLTQSQTIQKLQEKQLIKGIILTREPGGTRLGQSIRKLLLNPEGAYTVESRTELLLYAADRAQHVDETLRPALAQNFLVLCDRYTDSTVAYQGFGRQLNLDLINQLNQIATQGLEGDLTVWLKLDVSVGLERIQNRGQADRIEQSGLDFHQRVHQGFEALAQKNPDRFATIEGNQSIAEISDQIAKVTLNFLKQWYPIQASSPN